MWLMDINIVELEIVVLSPFVHRSVMPGKIGVAYDLVIDHE
jgi:hypothetical protein